MNTVHIAIKKLTQSDLSFFQVLLKHSKQKGINLNANVLVKQYFPSLINSGNVIDLPLAIIGPGGRNPHVVKRGIRRSRNSKNWRLNGVLVNNPKNEPTRYNALAPDDYGILIFGGVELPTTITLILISQIEDPKLYQSISEKFNFSGRDTMVDVAQQELLALLEHQSVLHLSGNPLNYVTPPDSEEDVLYGSKRSIFDQPAETRLVGLTPEQLQRQMQAAQASGQYGEELFGYWLLSRGQAKESFERVSETSARASYDYEIKAPFWLISVDEMFVDVKATKGIFERPFHMSFAEVRFAAYNQNYRIARIFNLDTPRPKIYILAGMTELAKQLLEKFKELPNSIAIDSISVSPVQLIIEVDSAIEMQVGAS